MNTDIQYILKNIHSASGSLEVFSYSAVASMDGAYGAEDSTYTDRRMKDVLLMLETLAALHTDLKSALEVKP